MTETEKLRRLLDERGVEWQDQEGPFPITAWESNDVIWVAKAYRTGVFSVETRPVTPEQAIAATLGNGECENVAPDYLDFLCSVCGFVHYHSDENDTGDGNDWAYCPRCGKAVKR